MATNIVNSAFTKYYQNYQLQTGNKSWVSYSIAGGSNSTSATYYWDPVDWEGYTISILVFTAPSFSGTSEYITFTFPSCRGPGENIDINLRFSLCSSMENRNSYVSLSNPSDPYRIAQVTKTTDLPSASDYYYENRSVTINTTALTPGTTYYLIVQLMTGPGTEYVVTLYDLDTATIEIGYSSASYVYIDNASSLGTYFIYIDNGTSWDLYTPYIDNGTSWDKL